jgi:hypothetical protein
MLRGGLAAARRRPAGFLGSLEHPARGALRSTHCGAVVQAWAMRCAHPQPCVDWASCRVGQRLRDRQLSAAPGRGRELRAHAGASSFVAPYCNSRCGLCASPTASSDTESPLPASPYLHRDPHRVQPHRWRELLDAAGHEMPGMRASRAYQQHMHCH